MHGPGQAALSQMKKETHCGVSRISKIMILTTDHTCIQALSHIGKPPNETRAEPGEKKVGQAEMQPGLLFL